MNCMNYLQRFFIWVSPLAQRPPSLLDAVYEAKRTWMQALTDFNHTTDRDLVDFAIHNIKASERRYIALIKKAKEDRVTAWPKDICAAGPDQDQTESQRVLAD